MAEIPESTKSIPDRLAGAVSEDAIRHLMIRSPLNQAIYKVLREHDMSNMSFADDPAIPYPLVDLMSNPAPADIGSGEMQMVDLADAIESAVLSTRAAPPAVDREGLQKGLEFAVLTLAFHGRDRGTDREAMMLDDLEQLARELDPLMRRALVAIDSRSGHPDDEAVDRFAAQMKAKLATARAKGRGGWDDPAQCSTDYLRHLLHEHVAKGDPVDVANFCMMLAHYGASTALSADAIRQGEGEIERLVADAFVTCTSGNGSYAVTLKYPTLAKAQAAHNMLSGIPATPASHASDGGKA